MGLRDPYEGTPLVTPRAAAGMVLAACHDRRPFSLVRLGDGEFPMLGLDAEAPPAQVEFQLDALFGPYRPAHAVLAGFVRDLREAVRQADIIGLPRASRQRADPNCAYVGRLFARHALHRPGSVYTDCNINHFFQLMLLFEDLLRGREFVGLVTPRDVVARLRDTFQIGAIRWHRVPDAFSRTHQQASPTHLPDVYTGVRDFLRPPRQGDLYLVGAGHFGKVYCHWIKAQGGIALDVGSLFDGWAEQATLPRLAQRPDLFSLSAYGTPGTAEERMAAYPGKLGEIWFGNRPTEAEMAFLRGEGASTV